jgi:hypothetical protein
LKDTGRLATNHPKKLDQGAIWFGILSTMGTVVYRMLSTHNLSSTLTWALSTFALSICGFFFYLHGNISRQDQTYHKAIRNNFAILWLFLSCIPAYFLSTLWADARDGVCFCNPAAGLQVVGWFL